MKQFNVINFDFNARKFVAYDVIPYLVSCYNKRVEIGSDDERLKVPKTYDEFKKFVKDESMYQFWSRCEYEIILVDWPNQKTEEKWDVYEQIMMNLDIVTEIVMEAVK